MPTRTRSRSTSRAGSGRSPRRPKPEAAAPPPAPAAPPAPESPGPIVVTEPELVFAARAAVPEPPRPLPAVRRSVFIDVENSSRPEHVAQVLDHLAVDWGDRRTEVVAVGNWRVIGLETARLLARRGAQLVHSAPSTGVRDWSDLRIAVAAGVWLASARPGDSIEIVSNDQAFDAVGDVAASLGIAYRRLSIHGLAERAVRAAHEPPPSARRLYGRGRRRRSGRRGPGPAGAGHPAAIHRAHPPAPPERFPATVSTPDATPGPAPAEEIRKTVEELLAGSPHGVTLDALSKTLKAHGFSRPPGSLRLVTRLRHLKGIEVTRSGLVRLIAPHHHVPAGGEMEPSPPRGEPVEDSAADGPAGQAPGPASRRRRRRGGRRRRRPAIGSSAAIAPVDGEAPEAAAEAPSG